MKKLIFVDSDGTLKNSEGLITDYTKDILYKLKNIGINVIITTGRPRYHALKVMNLSNASNYVISSNGAEIYDFNSDKVIYADYMKKEDILKISDVTNKYGARFAMTVDDKEVVIDEVKNEHQILLDEQLELFLSKNKIKQVFVRIDDPSKAIPLYKDISELDNIKIINESSFFKNGIIEKKGIWFSVTNESVNKGVAIANLCKYLNISLDDTIGIGNDYNDIEMFNVVNESIIIDNNNKDIHKYANYVGLSNDNDGVAKYLVTRFISKEG